MNYFPTLQSQSRIWVYPASRVMTPEECLIILNELKSFVQTWDSHGAALKADVTIIESQFVVVGVDENIESPSGCSIDRSVKLMKLLGGKLSIDFFNRLKLVVEKNNERKTISFSELENYKDWNIYNPLIKTVKELNESFLIPVCKSGLIL